MATSRVCPWCKVEKPIDEFGWNRCAHNGRSSHCLKCRREKAKEFRDRTGTPPQRYRLNPDMHKAGVTLRRAVRDGKVVRPEVCPRCGIAGRKVEAHHHLGYAREHWLDVIWVCRPCHHLLHSKPI